MAGRKREPYFTPTLGRTIERIALAALAALATRGEGVSVAVAALTIFVIVAVGEEIGRGFVLHGKRVTLRELAFRRLAGHRLPMHESRPRHRRRAKRAAPGAGGGDPAAGQGDIGGREVQEPGRDRNPER